MSEEAFKFTWPVFLNFLTTVCALVVFANVISEDKSILHVIGASVGLSGMLTLLVGSVVMFVLRITGADISD